MLYLLPRKFLLSWVVLSEVIIIWIQSRTSSRLLLFKIWLCFGVNKWILNQSAGSHGRAKPACPNCRAQEHSPTGQLHSWERGDRWQQEQLKEIQTIPTHPKGFSPLPVSSRKSHQTVQRGAASTSKGLWGFGDQTPLVQAQSQLAALCTPKTGPKNPSSCGALCQSEPRAPISK